MKKLKGGEMMHRRTLGFLTIIVILSFLVSGCYYFSSIREGHNAERAIEELKAMDGQKLAPYELTSAEQLMAISNREFNQLDFGNSRDFAVRSKLAAEAGIDEAKKTKK
jgi:hypothetical protein